MRSKNVKRWGLFLLIFGMAAAGVVAFMWFKPHRNVQAAKVFAELTVNHLVAEFAADPGRANEKYLSGDGNSKVLIVDGTVKEITTNQRGEKVIRLKEPGAQAGVSCTFTKEAGLHLGGVQKGAVVRVKGAITAGNRYDADLDLAEDAVLVQCDLVH